jgi:integrase
MPKAPKVAHTHAATAAEVAAVVRTFDMRTGLGLRDAAMVSLMFRSGLRVGELAQIDRVDLDLERRCVRLGVTKNGEPRTPPLHPETIAVVGRYLRRRGEYPGALFVNVGGRRSSDRLTTNAIQNIVKKAAKRAGVPVTPHCLRRGFVAEYLAHGGDIATLMVIGGWASEVMIYRYMGDLRAATAQGVFDQVAARQVAARGRNLRAVG